MNSRVSWSVDGIDPSVRERAEAAARRAGMSLGDWLNATIGEAPTFTSPNFRPRTDLPHAPLPERDVQDVAEIHQRLDAITRQIEAFSRPAAASEPAVARQLNDAISRLDARLSQVTEPARPAPQPEQHADRVERAAEQVYSTTAPPSPPRPPFNPASLDSVIAEITARQHELDDIAPRRTAQVAAAPAAAVPDVSAVERQLARITSQIEAMQRSDSTEQSIAAFRAELAEIRSVITDAMPRRAIESIETEIRSLSQRIDDTRQNGTDDQALAGVERALGEIHTTLRALTPAEQLAGFDDAINNLGGKIDLIVRSSDDPGTIKQLEGAIAALREIVSNVASNEALQSLAQEVKALSSKVDELAKADDYSDSFAALEARIATLTTTLENRERPTAVIDSDHLESALKALSDRLDHLPVGNDSSSTFVHLEQRVSYLLERLESSTDSRAGNLGRVEDGLQDILRHLERQQSTFAALAEARNASSVDPALVDTIKRELTDLRFTQSETDRHTQDSLEVVHSTLGHVVDRLAMIEGDLRTVRAAPTNTPPVPPIPHAPAPSPRTGASAPPVPPPARPEMPNPAQNEQPPQARAPRPPVQTPPPVHFEAAPREFAATSIVHEPSFMPKAISDILDPRQNSARQAALPTATRAARPVTTELPPDFPLEPGTRPQVRTASPSERIAASEDAISELSAGAPAQASASGFIAAARRAAQAAANGSGDRAAKPVSKSRANERPGEKSADKAPSISSKIRSLLVGASVVVIVLGSFKVAMTMLDAPSSAPFLQQSTDVGPLFAPEPDDSQPAPAPVPAPQMPSMTSPTPMGRQSVAAPVPQAAPIPFLPVAPAVPAVDMSQNNGGGDITGSITAPQSPVLPPSGNKIGRVSIPATEQLPDAIGGVALRSAALKGDAAAAYEVGVRYAEGKGVPPSYDEAAKWYDRAAQAGVVPAMFRLGTLYEKGLSVKKDLDVARRYYLLAAERGNAKAMHNLAVLDADGGTRGANYKSASTWFRKAAERGVADSQFNLGILYARGIGVEQNLAESYKWFSLAAAQGDADSARKRDDIGKRLDPQSLAAAKLAVQTFAPEGQPDDAINVATPPGGWDAAPQAANKALGKRASR